MALAPKLELRQGQTLVMTPQLQQAIKLLQLSNIELSAFVEAELERNPLLERDEAEEREETETSAREPETPADAGNGTSGDGTDDTDEPTLEPLPPEFEDGPGPAEADFGMTTGNGADQDETPLDTDDTIIYDEDTPSDGAAADGMADGIGLGGDGWTGIAGHEGETGLGDAPDAAESLRDHLMAQMTLLLADATERMIGANLIDGLDDAGYLTESVDEIAARLGAETAEVEAVRQKLTGLDPTGVMARDLAECLALQLRERDRLDPMMESFLGHLDLLAKRDLKALMRACQADEEDIADMMAEIRHLDPKPGLRFGGEPSQTVVPDVYIARAPDGTWKVELNSDTLPRVLVNARYYATVRKAAKDPKDTAYLTECLSSANWLVRSLDQRARTILKVASELVRQQSGYFEHGIQYLKPLNLRMVSEAVGIHESTVSRVTANKYVATPRGIFEMKYFFTSAIPRTQGGDAVSSAAVRERIRVLIERETPEAVLSDDQIVSILKRENVDIARRTVAKYREAMRIPSSVQRRRAKKLLSA